MSEKRDVTARGFSKPSWLTKLERLAESSGADWTTWMERELFPWEAREVLKALEAKHD